MKINLDYIVLEFGNIVAKLIKNMCIASAKLKQSLTWDKFSIVPEIIVNCMPKVL